MAIKSKLLNGKLQLRVSFRRAKAGMEFKTMDELEEYADDLGRGVSFSLDANASSPFVRKVGAMKRDKCWNKPTRISELVTSFYVDKSSKLHYGF